MFAPLASAFPIGPQPPFPSTVWEYFHPGLGHYFYTIDRVAMERGDGGQGWLRTGQGFSAFASLEASMFQGSGCDAHANPCKPVSRFYGAGPNSHFYTGHSDEAQFLRDNRLGWQYEGAAFFIPMPDAAGRCAANTKPVHRFYNDRYAFNDSNHRFTASEMAKEVMLELGWRYEGVAFCTYVMSTENAMDLRFATRDPANLRTLDTCRTDAAAPVSCIGFANLPVPTVLFDDRPSANFADPFNERTGVLNFGNMPSPPNGVILATTESSREQAAMGGFIQLKPGGEVFGLHMHTRERGPAAYSTVTAIRRMPAGVPSFGIVDGRFMPWRNPWGTPHELWMSYGAGIRYLVTEPGSHAYGAWTMEFVDIRSGHRLQFNILSFGTVGAVGDFVGRDVKTGIAMGSAAAGAFSRFATATSGRVTQQLVDRSIFHITPTDLSSTMNAAQFKVLLSEARIVDPALSADPADYALDFFGATHEIYGDGELGLLSSGGRLMWMPAR